ncbi:MAG: ribonuclease [Clostridia bacterium]|nr:ribonuclease [Clostridia bacterium]
MFKKLSAKLISLITILAMLFTIAGCSDESIQEIVSLGSEILEAVDEESSDEGQIIEEELEETTTQTTKESDVTTEAEQSEKAEESEATEEATEETSETTSESATETVAETTTEETTVAATTEITETTKTTEATTAATTTEAVAETTIALLDPDGSYTSKDDVALYIYQYGELPNNFITKKEARNLGWEGGSLEPYASGMSIGGDYFGNYEGLLPEANGREYHECDIDTMGASSRGAKRIIYSNDGLIYYTSDHYESFTLLYGEE